MNAELFDNIIKNASFNLELFYDMKPNYYSFMGERKKLDRDFKEIWALYFGEVMIAAFASTGLMFIGTYLLIIDGTRDPVIKVADRYFEIVGSHGLKVYYSNIEGVTIMVSAMVR